MAIFQKSVVNKYLKSLDNERVLQAYQILRKYYGNMLRVNNILQLKEENYQEGFLREIFVNVLGYTINPDVNFNLTTEFKNKTDNKKADGAILKDNQAVGVIELKSTKTRFIESITNQAFSYKHNQPNCRYVITSNFHILRFYIDNSTEFEEFDLFTMNEFDFRRLYLFLSQESIFNEIPLQLKEETKFHEQNISDKFYTDYKRFKDKLFENLVINNQQYDKLTLFKKSQKLLDRFLFVYFAEDCGLCPPNSIQKIIDQWNALKSNDAYASLYSRFQKLFDYLNVGKKFETFEFPAYNGGLFKPDELLDKVKTKIDDSVLLEFCPILSVYDFNTDIDVNILGHIFEHSLNEIEEITAELSGETIDKNKTKRKKEGIFYTPKYITQYVIQNTIGTACINKKADLQINEAEITNRDKDFLAKLKTYKNWLLSLKILDPACGSGAFLNQAIEFLINEHKQIDELISELTGDKIQIFDIDKNILENNIFGVDINDESVEIAKLSLWLRTAKKDRKLSDLNNNIKCGNSLISNADVAGKKAFNWNKSFSEIMKNGGFDVIIGNPPYIRIQNLKDNDVNYFTNNYQSAKGKFDIYLLFNELALKLIKPEGLIGFIEPHKFLVADFGKNFRNLILQTRSITKIISFSDLDIFTDAVTYTCLLFLKKTTQNEHFDYFEFTSNYKNLVEIELPRLKSNNYKQICYNNLSENQWTLTDNAISQLLQKLNQAPVKLSHITANLSQGVIPGSDKIYYLTFVKDNGNTFTCFSESKNQNIEIEKSILKPVIKGNNVKCYLKPSFNYYIIYPYRLIDNKQEIIPFDELQQNFPLTAKYLTEFKTFLIDLRIKYKTNQAFWYGYHRAREMKFLETAKILTSHASQTPNFTYTETNFYYNQNVYGINLLPNVKINYHQLLGLLNSNICDFFIRNTSSMIKGGYYLYKTDYLVNFAIPNKTIPETVDKLVNELLELNKNNEKTAVKFVNRLLSEFKKLKVTQILETFYQFDFSTIVNELKKQKITVTFKQKDEWEDYYNDYKAEIKAIKEQILELNNQLNTIIYDLYELNTNEISVLQNSIRPYESIAN